MSLAVACGSGEGDEEPLYGRDDDNDGWPSAFDCDDRDNTVFPAADEVPGDGIDQDCSGSDALLPGMGGASPMGGGGQPGATGGSGGNEPNVGLDADGDGFDGGPDGDDCDDTRREVFPGALEIVLNGIDENCDGSDLAGGDSLIDFLPEAAVPGEPVSLAVVEHEGAPHLFAAWTDSRVAPRQDLYGQLYDLDGQPVGDEVDVETSDNNAKGAVRLVSRGDALLVTWTTVDGLWVRQLGSDGVPMGIALGFGEPGAYAPSPAYSKGHWAVAWRDPKDGGRGLIRAMTAGPVADGGEVRGDILSLGQGTIGSVALAGNADGYLAVWSGPLSGDSGPRGLLGQARTKTGFPVGEPFPVYEQPVGNLSLTFDGTEYFAAFRVPSDFGYAAGQLISDGLEVSDARTAFRLSSESAGQSGFAVTPVSDGGFFSAWDDDRHVTHQPPAESVYGNRWQKTGLKWSSGAALAAAADARLGGLVEVDGSVYLTIHQSAAAQLLVLEL